MSGDPAHVEEETHVSSGRVQLLHLFVPSENVIRSSGFLDAGEWCRCTVGDVGRAGRL